MEYEALVDFEAVENNELTIRVGDIITVTDTSNEHWWYGKLSSNNKEGLFPSSFVKKYTSQKQFRPDVSNSSIYNRGAGSLLNTMHPFIDSCLEKLKNVSSSAFKDGSDSADQLECEARCERFRPFIIDRIEELSVENQQLSAAISKYNECISAYQKSTMENYQGVQNHYPRQM